MDDKPKKLTKQPHTNSVPNSRSSFGNGNQLRRHPSAPQSPASDRSNDNHTRTYSSHTSSSSVEPSPNLAESKFSAHPQPDPYTNRYRYSAQQSLNERSSDELIAPDSNGPSALDSTKATGYQNSLRRPGPPSSSHTSPDPRMISPQLRQSASFSVADRSIDVIPPRSDTGLSASKRYSGDETKNLAPWRKKSGFSSFVSSVLGSPRNVKISAPGNPVHVTHVGFDNETGQFTVCFYSYLSFRQFHSLSVSLESPWPFFRSRIVGTSKRMAAGTPGEWNWRDRAETASSGDLRYHDLVGRKGERKSKR